MSNGDKEIARIFYQWWGTAQVENRLWTLLSPNGEVEDYNTRDSCISQAKKMGWKYQVERHHRKHGGVTIMETNLHTQTLGEEL